VGIGTVDMQKWAEAEAETEPRVEELTGKPDFEKCAKAIGKGLDALNIDHVIQFEGEELTCQVEPETQPSLRLVFVNEQKLCCPFYYRIDELDEEGDWKENESECDIYELAIWFVGVVVYKRMNKVMDELYKELEEKEEG